MIDYSAFSGAVALVRAAGLIPTHTRLWVARHMLDEERASSLDELTDMATEDGLGLSRETLARTLALLTRGGPEMRT
ncbi:hypothetical protein [Magnetospirillum molischianum]|uniref:Transposase n=1 Tax=Magnetospirillum molischianum DSM 120 TaxID=1150626 RepID=H8FTC5_MAGML|nr:hypothetical protein [Magnetospirillum molischianum]CCG41613.1 hypothetical protein PHAMO_280147 [Magnetospirillum molischianum DSM 120]